MSRIALDFVVRIIAVISMLFSPLTPLTASAAPARQENSPVANFSATPQSGTAPLEVSFSNTSTEATQYRWDFGDGSTLLTTSGSDGSSIITPTHTYLQSGLYTVTLIAGNGVISDTLVQAEYISVSEATTPEAAFAATPTDGSAPLAVTFSNNSSNASQYRWDFGDGIRSNEAEPLHTYQAGGVYTVTLVAGDGVISDTLVQTEYISVSEAVTPEASFTATPTDGSAPLSVTFENNSTNATQYRWEFGDGTVSGEAEPLHTYQTSGLYTVTLIAGDGIISDTLVQSGYITVSEAVTPEAAFSATPLSGTLPLTVSFANNSTNAGQYRWDFGDGSTLLTTSGSASSETAPLHTYQAGGVYTVTLIAGDGVISDTLVQVEYISVNEAVTPEAAFTATPADGSTPLTVSFANNSTNAAQYRWDFGDGVVSNETAPLHTYSQSGLYTVTLIAGDGVISDTLVQSGAIRVVEPEAPLPAFSATPLSGTLPLTVTFTNESLNATHYHWDFGDGLTHSSLITPHSSLVHTYQTSGLYTVTLLASNGAVTESLVRPALISVTAPPIVDFQATPLSGPAPLTVTFSSPTDPSVEYVLDFGDNSSFIVPPSSFLTATHLYTQPGLYTATLQSDSGILSRTIRVSPALTAAFTAFPQSGPEPLLVQFLNSSIGAEYYEWDFGDDMSANIASPAHTYYEGGVYTVTLTAGNGQVTETVRSRVEVEAPDPGIIAFEVITEEDDEENEAEETEEPEARLHLPFGSAPVAAVPAVMGPLRPSFEVQPAAFSSLLPTQSLTDGLVGYWALDESSGSRSDSSGNGYHLSAYNDAPGLPGKSGKAADLEKDDYQFLWDDSAGGGPTITGSLTLAGWVRPESENTVLMVGGRYQDGPANNKGYQIYLNNLPVFQVSNDGANKQTLVGSSSFQAGQWYHLAATFDAAGQSMKLYVNGVVDGSNSVSFSSLYPSSSPFVLGTTLNDGSASYFFDGRMDEWRLYERALSQSEVQDLMNQPLRPGAGFEPSVTAGLAPLNVTFNNSSANATSYRWDFGDGATSSDTHPNHTWLSGGLYTVTLQAGDGSVTDTHTTQIEVTTLDQGLVGYWSLDESSGVRYDGSGQGNDLAEHNNVGAASGQEGQAADFDANSSHYLSIDHTVQQNLSITGSLTLVGWARLESPTAYMALAGRYQKSPTNNEESYRFYLKDRLFFQLSPDGVSRKTLAGNTTGLQANQWYHLAAVFEAEAQEMRLYLDGVLDKSSSTTFNSLYPSTRPFMLGATGNHDELSQFFDGQMDEWRVYNRALRQEEIQTLMNPPTTQPQAAFTATPLSGSAPLTVTFSNNSGGATLFNWNFGDDNQSSDTHPSHRYDSAGVYTVTLIAGDGAISDTLTRINYITVTEVASPVANFNATPLSGTLPLTVTFVNSSTNATQYAWDFGDGNDSSLAQPTHVYTQAGVFSVTLLASDGNVTDTLLQPAYITVTEPVIADFSAFPLAGDIPLLVQFLNNSQNATDYLWDFGDGITSTLASPTHTYTVPNVYTVSLRAEGASDTHTLTKSHYITVTGSALLPAADFSASPQTGTVPLTVTFTNSSTHATEYQWSFGDGTTLAVTDTVTATHVYTQSGLYTVTLTASDGTLTDTLTRTHYITVTPIVRQWQQITSATTLPPVIGEQSMAYNGSQSKVILYGGNATGWPYEQATWELVLSGTEGFDGSDWLTATLTGPPARYGAGMAYDGSRLLLFGGNDENDTAFNQTWEYTGSTWVELSPATSPLSRTNHSLVAGSNGVIYLFGGNNSDIYYNDLWKFENGDWNQINVAGDNPAPRTLTALAYQTTDQLLLFGGRSITGTLLADLWAFDPAAATWQLLDGGGPAPPARMAHSLTWDPPAGNAVLFGGATDEGNTLLNDLWLYDSDGWRQVTPDTLPQGAAYHRSNYTDNAILLVGNGEVWSYE